MALFEHFPYTNFHEMNLDWLLNRVKNIEANVENLSEEAGIDCVYVHVTYDAGSGTYKSDTDGRHIVDAFLAGKKVICVYNNIEYPGVIYAGLGGVPNGGAFRGMNVTEVTSSSATVTFEEFIITNTVAHTSFSTTLS